MAIVHKKYSEFTERQQRGIVMCIARRFSYWSFDAPNLANTIRPRFFEINPMIQLQGGHLVTLTDADLSEILQREIGKAQSFEANP
jgi:hypothetical protein